MTHIEDGKRICSELSLIPPEELSIIEREVLFHLITCYKKKVLGTSRSLNRKLFPERPFDKNQRSIISDIVKLLIENRLIFNTKICPKCKVKIKNSLKNPCPSCGEQILHEYSNKGWSKFGMEINPSYLPMLFEHSSQQADYFEMWRDRLKPLIKTENKLGKK